MPEMISIIAIALGATIAVIALVGGIVFFTMGKKQGTNLKNNTYLKCMIVVFAVALVILIAGCIMQLSTKNDQDNYWYEDDEDLQDDSSDNTTNQSGDQHSETTLTPLADMTKWTIKDVGMSDGEYSEHQSKTTESNLDKKALKAYVVFPSGIDASHNAQLWIGEYSNGFVFEVKNNTLALWHYETGKTPQAIKYFLAETAGLTSLFDEAFELTFSTEFINSKEDKTDVSIGVYINGKLYGDKFLTLEGVSVNSLKQQIHVYNKWSGGKTIWLGSNQKPAEKAITTISKLSKWTIEKVGLDTGEYNIQNGTASSANLDKKAFECAVVFPEITEQGRESKLWIGGQDKGFLFSVKNGKLLLSHFSSAGEKKLTEIIPSTAGVTKVLGEELFIQLTTEFENNNGKTTDVNVALYINNKRYNDKYFKLEAVPLDSLQQQVCVDNQWAGGKLTWISPVMKKDIPPATSPSKLTKWNIQTVDMEAGEYRYKTETEGVAGKATGKNLDQTAFYGKVTFPQGMSSGQEAELWIGEQGNGIRFVAKGEEVQFIHMASGKPETILATLSPAKVNLSSLVGRELELIVTVEFTKTNGSTTDVNIGLYINGILYNDAYFKLKSVPVSSFKQQVVVYTRWSGDKTIRLGTY